MINDLYTTLTITYYTICTLIRGKEDRSVGRGVFFTNILLDIEVLARGLDLFCIYCIVVESV